MKNQFLYCVVYFSFVAVISILLYNLGIVHTLPSNQNIINWDGKWYLSIVNDGYQYIYNSTCNLAFFPLFPYLWKVSGLNGIGIAIANYLLFVISFIFFYKNFYKNLTSFVFILSLPPMIFFALPYSEAIFFLSGALILVGYKENNTLLKVIGFFLSSLTRSISLIYIPAIILCEILTNKKSIKASIYSIIANITGTLLVATIQFVQTGKWMYFLEVQKFWGRSWKFPQFPFTNFNAKDSIGFDAIALIIGISALLYLSYIVFNKYIHKLDIRRYLYQPELIFSILYICAITILDCLFTRTFDGKTNIWSINRHLIASPFGIYFLLYITRYSKVESLYRIILICVFFLLALFLTTSYQYHFATLALSVFVSLVVLFNMKEQNKLFKLTLCGFLVFCQIICYHQFILHKWIG